jgi:hypothetical protein
MTSDLNLAGRCEYDAPIREWAKEVVELRFRCAVDKKGIARGESCGGLRDVVGAENCFPPMINRADLTNPWASPES